MSAADKERGKAVCGRMHDLLAGIREVVDKSQDNISIFVLFVLEVCVDLFVPFD